MPNESLIVGNKSASFWWYKFAFLSYSFFFLQHRLNNLFPNVLGVTSRAIEKAHFLVGNEQVTKFFASWFFKGFSGFFATKPLNFSERLSRRGRDSFLYAKDHKAIKWYLFA